MLHRSPFLFVLTLLACGSPGDRAAANPESAETPPAIEEAAEPADEPARRAREEPEPAGECEPAMTIERDEGVAVEHQVAEPQPWPASGLAFEVTARRGAARVTVVAEVRNGGGAEASFDYFTGGDPRNMGPLRASLVGAAPLAPNGMPGVLPQPRRERLPAGARVRFVETVCLEDASEVAVRVQWSFASAGDSRQGELTVE